MVATWVNSRQTCTHGGVGLDLDVVRTEVTLHAELVDGCGVVVAHLGLLGVVPYAHPDVVPTPLTPDVVRHLKPARGETG